MNLIVSCLLALLPWHQPGGMSVRASGQHLECTVAVLPSMAHAKEASLLEYSAVAGLPALLILGLGQWGAILAALFLLALAALRWELHRRRHKDKALLRQMHAEYESMQNNVVKLEQLEGVLQQRLRIQERLITAILHDVKSPLYYLLISARALSQRITTTTDGLQADAAAFYDATYRMYQLLDNLLQYVKLHAQHKHDVKEEVQLHALVAEKIALFSNMATAKNIRIENAVGDETVICCDRAMLAIILHNLLDNAIKFTEAGTVRIRASTENGSIKLEIADSGVGMHEGWMAWVNQPLNTSQPDLPTENGLGLIIVKELLAEINGHLKMWSSDKGTIAQITLGV